MLLKYRKQNKRTKIKIHMDKYLVLPEQISSLNNKDKCLVIEGSNLSQGSRKSLTLLKKGWLG